MKKIALYSTIFLTLSGCMVGPNYTPPINCIPDEWIETACPSDVILSDDVPLCDWWEVFYDPLLNQYIAMGAAYNNSLSAAEANIFQARALRQVAASKLYPQINADFNALRVDLSKNGPLAIIGAHSVGPTASSIFNIFNAIVDASWEIDVFGKIRRTVEAADATMGVMIEQRNNLLLTILAEIAMNYFQVRSSQQQELLVLENIEILEKNAEIIREQFKSGYRNGLDLEKIEAELATAKADLPNICAQIYQGIYALSVLTGSPPEALLEQMLPTQPLPCVPFEVSMGLRSDLICRRPDVREAERQLAYTVANVGVAVASFFPRFNILGDYGFESIKLSKLFTANSKTWLIDGNVSLPLFQGGNLVGNLKASEAASASAAFTYQQTVLNALQETESAAVAYSEQIETSELLSIAVERNERVVQLANQRYIGGLTTLLDLLDSERQLNATKQSLLKSETAALLNLVSLYKALGGGWDIDIAFEDCDD